MYRAAFISGGSGDEFIPSLLQVGGWIHALVMLGPEVPVTSLIVSWGQTSLLEAAHISSPAFDVTPLLRLHLGFASKNTSLWLGCLHDLNYFLSFSLLLNHGYCMTACKLNMHMIWISNVDKSSLEVWGSFIAATGHHWNRVVLNIVFPFPIIGYSTCK